MVGAGIVNGEEEKIDRTNLFFLEVKYKNSIFAAGLNGVQLIDNKEGGNATISYPINGWLMPGENRLTFKLTPFPDAGSMPTANIKVYLHDSKEETPTPGVVIAEYNYPAQGEKATGQNGLVDWQVSFVFDTKIPVRLWDEASIIKTLDANDKKEIVKLANDLRDALLNKDIDKLVHLQEYRLQEDALAENKTVSELQEAMIESYEWMLGLEGMVVGPSLELEQANFETCCKDKVVILTRKKGPEAVQLETDELYFDIDIYVAKINQQWKIVR